MVDINAIVQVGKLTLEAVRSPEGSGVFEPTLLAMYEDGTSEVTLLVGGMNNEILADGMMHVAKRGPLHGLALTTDVYLDGGPNEALIVLYVDVHGDVRTAFTPYICEGHLITWDDTEMSSSDPRLTAALQLALGASRAKMSG